MVKCIKHRFILFLLFCVNIISIPAYSEELSDNNVQSKKIIYLTFDDGPAGKVTSDVLDILKNENVNATFFLIGDQINNQEKLVKRIADEGHSIGLHSMTHKKNYLYSCNSNFLKEMIAVQEKIEPIVGFKPVILRFPFGCNNNSYKITQSMIDLLHKNNLKIYDWNVDSGDGANPNSSPATLLKNSKSDKDKVVLLMHCAYISKNTVKALPSIIKYYKDNNYQFKIIDNDTPEEYHCLRK